jgi:hypothetical protein
MMEFRILRLYILAVGGGTAGFFLANNILDREESLVRALSSRRSYSEFFRPFEQKTDLYKIYSPVTAPIAFALMAGVMLIGAMINTLLIVISALLFDGERLKNNSKKLVENLAVAFVLSIGVFISPVVNLVDLIGSVVNTLRDTFKASSSQDVVDAMTPSSQN